MIAKMLNVVTVAACLATVAMATPVMASNFGAIAFSQATGAQGYSFDYKSRAQAEQRALTECYNYGGSNCRITTWFRDACGALAVGNGNAWGASWGNNRRQAEQKALNLCYNEANGCRIVRWVCVSR